jgi:hypothetical protein
MSSAILYDLVACLKEDPKSVLSPPPLSFSLSSPLRRARLPGPASRRTLSLPPPLSFPLLSPLCVCVCACSIARSLSSLLPLPLLPSCTPLPPTRSHLARHGSFSAASYRRAIGPIPRPLSSLSSRPLHPTHTQGAGSVGGYYDRRAIGPSPCPLSSLSPPPHTRTRARAQGTGSVGVAPRVRRPGLPPRLLRRLHAPRVIQPPHPALSPLSAAMTPSPATCSSGYNPPPPPLLSLLSLPP